MTHNSRTYILSALLIYAILHTVNAMAASPIENADTIAIDALQPDTLVVEDFIAQSACDAFLLMPATVLDLITSPMRTDMIYYLQVADTIRKIPNSLGGLSYLKRPITSDFLSVVVSPVSTMTFKILPYKKKNLVGVTYTISDDGHAGDSEIAFYDQSMKPLKTDKYIKVAELEDFLDLPSDKKHMKKDLLALVPFPTVKYEFNPENDQVKASLTIKQYMSAEDYMKLEPYLRPQLTYEWTGSKYRLVKE